MLRRVNGGYGSVASLRPKIVPVGSGPRWQSICHGAAGPAAL
jgi:hypothetical protein